MKRRDFFKLGARKTAGVVYQVASQQAALRAEKWFRPPFAVAEVDLLLDCTRCDKCIEACPHHVLFTLPGRYGAEAAGTPALDLLNRGCWLCDDWPCVMVCEPRVLRLPDHQDGDQIESPKLAVASINEATCLPYCGPECGACKSACPVPGAMNWLDGLKPHINNAVCTGCALCRQACIVDPKAIDIRPYNSGEVMR